MENEDFFEANRRILSKSGSSGSQDFFKANQDILNSGRKNVSTINNVGERREIRGGGVKVYQSPKSYDKIKSPKKRKSLIKKMVIGTTIFTVVITGAVVISNLINLSGNKGGRSVPNTPTSSSYVESSVGGQFIENSSDNSGTYGISDQSESYENSDESYEESKEENESYENSDNDTETYEESTEESDTYDVSNDNIDDNDLTDNKSYFTYDGEYDEIVDYFNSFIDGQVYQIGTTPEVNEGIRDFLYNTDAGQYIQYYSKEFGVDPKMSVAIAAGESSLLHDLNDGAATGLFGLEKGIKDQFWVYDYYENKNVLIVNDPDDNYDIRTNIRNGIAILAYKYSDNGNIYDALGKYNLGTYGFNCMLDENYYECNSINDRGWRIYTEYYCSKYEIGTPDYIDNIGECLFEDVLTMKCRDVEITMEYSTGKIISINKIPGYNYEEADTFDEIINDYRKTKTL